MLEINGHQYKLVYIDTNCINEISKNTKGVGRNFLERYADGKHMFVTSCFNIYELSKSNGESRKVIVDIFGNLPLAIIYVFPQTIILEEQYTDLYEKIIMLTIGMKPLFKTQLNDIFKSMNGPEWQKTFQKMNYNFQKEIKYCNDNRSNCNWQKDFSNNLLKTMKDSLNIYLKNENINSFGKYKSLEIFSYVKNQFIYNSSKKIEMNSVIDWYNASALPYVEEYITERTVGSWLEMAKNKFEYIKEKKIIKISNLYDEE